MNHDIRIKIGFLDHPKTVKLKRRLGFDGVESLMRLWMFAAQWRPSGVFTEMDLDDIEIAVRWPGEPGALVEALLDTRFLEQVDNSYQLHDWEQHNGYASSSQDRSDKSRFSRLASTHPQAFKELKAQGVDAISAEDYRALTNAKRPLNESSTNRSSERISPLPSPSPSPFPSLKSKKPLPRKTARGTSPDHSYFTRWWCYAFERVTGAKFVFLSKHAGIISQILKRLDLEELISRACVYLTMPDDRRFPRGSPTIEGLSNCINQLAGKCTPGIEDTCFKYGIIPDFEQPWREFTPWVKAAGKQDSSSKMKDESEAQNA